MIINKFKNIISKKNKKNNPINIFNLKLDKKPEDIFIIGNAPSLNDIKPEQLENKFTIGTNRSWLWGDTDMLIWRDNRITEEIEFFKLEKQINSLWVCSNDKSFIPNQITDYKYTKELIDFTFDDKWLKKIFQLNIKWNGIVFHAIALAKHISKKATIHLIGIDLILEQDKHHFFSKIPGFNQGFYKAKWNKTNFNYEKRLDMMCKNFELLKNNGYNFKNYSINSKLTELFGYEELK